MVLIALGLLLWSFAHLVRRLAPEHRAQFIATRGEAAWKGMVSLAMVLGLVLLVLGYNGYVSPVLWTAPGWGWHLNNLLMLVAVLLFGMSGSKGWLGTRLRHPMLLGVMVWAAAHLLVNGDAASLLLFGGMGVWALSEIYLINRAEPGWTRPLPAPPKKDVLLVVITLVAFGVITFIHGLIGPSPFPG